MHGWPKLTDAHVNRKLAPAAEEVHTGSDRKVLEDTQHQFVVFGDA